jgi:hypothetical protein
MSIARKIVKLADAELITEIETKITQTILGLKKNVAKLEKDLSLLQFNATKQVEFGRGKKAIVIHAQSHFWLSIIRFSNVSPTSWRRSSLIVILSLFLSATSFLSQHAGVV